MPQPEDVRRTNSGSRRGLAVAIVIAAGAALCAASLGAGCGGKTNDTPATSGDDTGTAIIDSGAADTRPDAPVIVDASKDTGVTSDDAGGSEYDAPGSLFDAAIPDVVFDGGTTAKGCYDCLTDKCHDQVAVCDSDPRCRGLVLCVLIDCKASTTDFGCLTTCAGAYGVSSPSDPILGEALGIVQCIQKDCPTKCPAPPDAGPPDAAKSDAPSSEVGSAEAGSTDAGAADARPASMRGGPSSKLELPMSIDPAVIETLQSFVSSFSDNPEGARSLVDRYSHE